MGRGVGLLVHAEDHAVVPGAEAEQVARLDLDLVGLHDPHQAVVADKFFATPAMMFQVDHHAPPLHRMRREIVDAQPQRADMLAQFDGAAIAVIDRADNVLAGAIAVIEDDLRLAVAVGVEELTDMGKAVPLGRILQRHLDHIVADDVDELRVLARQRVSDIGHALAFVGDKPRRVAARIDDRSAGVIERQRQTKGLALSDLGDALLDLFGGQQIEPAELIVRSPIAPGRAGGAAFPARIFGHGCLSFAPGCAPVASW